MEEEFGNDIYSCEYLFEQWHTWDEIYDAFDS